MMTREELADLGRTLAQSTKAYVGDSIAAVVGRLQALEERIASIKDGAPGADGKDGRDGKDGADAPGHDLDVIAAKAAARIAVPKDGEPGAPGRDGVDGKDGADAPVVDVDVIVEKVAAMVPAGRDGRDGQDADMDLVASKVMAGLSSQIAALVNIEVAKAITAIPRPKDGADGVGVVGALLDASGQLVLTLSNGSMQTLGRVVGEKGESGRDGNDGQDGFGFDDLDVTSDGERTLSLVFTKGERVRTFPISFPVQIHRGVFDISKSYERGDCATWGGSTWQAVRPTSGFKPGDGPAEKTGWLLVTKAGRDGRGKDGAPGERGRDGKDMIPKW